VTVEGPRPRECCALYATRQLGLDVALKSYAVYENNDVCDTDQRVLVGHYRHSRDVGQWDTFTYKEQGNDTTSLVVDMGATLNETYIRGVINILYGRSCLPELSNARLDSNFIPNAEALCARAWDTSKPPDTGYMFTCKPDGERRWLLYYGWCWYMMSKQRPHVLRKWRVHESHISVSLPPVLLDIEYVSGYGAILIDCLTSAQGDLAPIVRDLSWVTRTFAEILSTHAPCPVRSREYFGEYVKAQSYTQGVPYPTDGVVAVRNGSTEILKVKAIKSVELEHRGNGNMYCSEGVHVLTTSVAKDAPMFTVLELRFSLNQLNGEYTVWDAFPRPDKQERANSFAATCNVFRSANVAHTKDDDNRRGALLWCGALRDEINKLSAKASDTKHIVLDVGTGEGKSVSAMSKSNNVSYILVEPDIRKCTSIKRMLSGAELITELPAITSTIKQLKTRSRKHVILCCNLSELVALPDFFSRVVPEIMSIQAIFSLQFVTNDLYDILDKTKIPIYGCCYTYDDVNELGVLIDTCGIRMGLGDDATATVKWGGDKKYTEPAVMSKDLHGLGRVINYSVYVGRYQHQ